MPTSYPIRRWPRPGFRDNVLGRHRGLARRGPSQPRDRGELSRRCLRSNSVRTDRSTLTEFLIEERRRHPDATGELDTLIAEVALACKAIAARVAYGALGGRPAADAGGMPSDQPDRVLPALADALFVDAT